MKMWGITTVSDFQINNGRSGRLESLAVIQGTNSFSYNKLSTLI